MYSMVPSPPTTQWIPAQSPTLERTLNNASTTPPISPTSPTRRLRGLSYLRSYTQNHLLSRESHSSSNNNNNNNNNNNSSSSSPTASQQRPSSLARASSYPSNRDSASASASAPDSLPPAENHQPSSPLASPTAQRTPSEQPSAIPGSPNHQENSRGTSGWLPTVGGQSGVSRIPTEPQSTALSSSAVLSNSNPSAGAAEQTTAMARTRSATTGAVLDGAENNGGHDSQHAAVNGGGENRGMAHQLPSIRFSAHQDPRAQRPSLVFSPMSRILPTGKETIKVGRYSERENQPAGAPNVPSAAPVGFKSKVVSRRHCEFWCSGGRWYIRDVKSSSGTFLNHIRLSSPGTESRPFPVNDGDIVQLGIDFKGGEEMIFRCVKIRVELNKGWQTGPSSFNVQSHKRLRELNSLNKTPGGSSQDCSICLGPIAPCQSLFVAPCSHTWHYKCIRVIINGPHWPHFICPNCRSVADLEAELDDPTTNGDWEEIESEDAVAQPTGAAEAAVPIVAAAQSQPQANNGEDSVMVEAEREAPDHGSDLDIADVSDDSDAAHAANQAAGAMEYTQVDDSLPESNPTASSATTAPVDIISRKPVGSSSQARAAQPEAGLDRAIARTPSPTGLGSSLDVAVGVEGPMTPRNDAGPFIFDGSAGRASGAGLVNVATNLAAAAADNPLHLPTPNLA